MFFAQWAKNALGELRLGEEKWANLDWANLD